MEKKAENLAGIVAQGWILMFLVLICIFLTEFVASVISGDFSMLRSKEGERALHGLVLLMVLHAVVPMLVLTVNWRQLKWAVTAITGVLAVIMVGHEIMHLMNGTIPLGFFHVLDFSHHGLGIWTTIMAIRWARHTTPSMTPAHRQARSTASIASQR